MNNDDHEAAKQAVTEYKINRELKRTNTGYSDELRVQMMKRTNDIENSMKDERRAYCPNPDHTEMKCDFKYFTCWRAPSYTDGKNHFCHVHSIMMINCDECK